MPRALLLPATIFSVMVALACWTAFNDPPPIDYFSFWSAARLVLKGDAVAAYASQPSIFGALMPLAYPPPFLLLVAPFGLLAFAPAFLAWTILTGALYLFAAGEEGRRMALASPPALSSGLVGQNGFLTAGIFLIGLRLVATRPLVAGLILGLMVIKPQLALLLPVALVAGRHWTSIVGAAASSVSLLVLAGAVFGVETYVGFIDVLGRYSTMLNGGRWPWNELASAYAFVRWTGIGEYPALAIQVAAAIVAALAVWTAWRKDWPTKLPIAAAASLLVSPYLFTYDAVLLVAPLVWLARRKPGWAVAIWCLALLPLLRGLGYAGPNGIAPAAMVALAVMVIAEMRDRKPA